MTRHLPRGSRCHGFTLVEIMIVVAIIALLVVLVLPAFSKARQTSLTQKCIQNQRLIFQAVQRYEMDFNTTLFAIRNDGVAIRNILVTNGYVSSQDAFECPASSVKDYDDINLLYNNSVFSSGNGPSTSSPDFTNTTCTIAPTTHILR
jgi:prepilin-type N-terminal cleavage/methylation domain-containing protein